MKAKLSGGRFKCLVIMPKLTDTEQAEYLAGICKDKQEISGVEFRLNVL